MAEQRGRRSAPASGLAGAVPPGRDLAVDALRALAVLGVVLGHWLVTALTWHDGGLSAASPLAHLPWLTPVSWVLQTLAVFFLVGGRVAATGYASARRRGVPYRTWVGLRLRRLFGPVAAVLALWTVVAGGMLVGGAEWDTVRTLVRLVLSPLWFLLVFAALTAATPLVARMSPLWPLAVVAGVDLWRFGLGGPEWLGWVNVAAGWLVPFALGAARARGGFVRHGRLLALAVTAATATAALVLLGGYPASMVGVPGAAVSNLNPPTLAAVTFGLAQCALALLAVPRLERAMRRPAVRTPVTLVNLSAMTLFLWHQTALMAVTALGLLVSADLPGLHTAPVSAGCTPCARYGWPAASWWSRRRSPRRSGPGAPCWRNAAGSPGNCTTSSPTTCR
ncbi:acyltransferase [Streptomyces sp. NPDC090112]|uniref:acyltransferase family protein n=1 Tax=Streptomyces sp. NPDC090112 TaxID=3365949 RepID=UPI0037FE42A3